MALRMMALRMSAIRISALRMLANQHRLKLKTLVFGILLVTCLAAQNAVLADSKTSLKYNKYYSGKHLIAAKDDFDSSGIGPRTDAVPSLSGRAAGDTQSDRAGHLDPAHSFANIVSNLLTIVVVVMAIGLVPTCGSAAVCAIVYHVGNAIRGKRPTIG